MYICKFHCKDSNYVLIVVVIFCSLSCCPVYCIYIYMEFFRHFSEEGHHGFLKDISVKIIDRLTGGNRMRESFWQYRLDCFAPKGLNTRQVDTKI